jgi:uncharacterized protein (DUF2336 family)
MPQQPNLNRLESLARLAKEASPEGRQELLREVTDMFLVTPDALTPTEIDYFGDIMGRLVFEMEMAVRQHLAETLSTVGAAPPDLVNRLANDAIEVARPVLSKSGVLKDTDLLEIIRKCGQEHLLAVSKRETVSETVADALVEKGDDAVLGALAGNAGATISRGAMEKMVERSENSEVLQAPLVHRGDLPPDLMKKMFGFVSDALRQHILSTFAGLNESQVDELMSEAESWYGAGPMKGEMTPAEKFIQRKEQLNQLNPAMLVKLIREGKMAEFIAGLARLGRIDMSVARQTATETSGEKLAVVCKALEIDNDVFAELVGLTDPKKLRSADDRAALIGVYRRITAESAQRAMRFLRTRQKLKKDSTTVKNWNT